MLNIDAKQIQVRTRINTNVTGQSIDIGRLTNFAIQGVCDTSTAAGTFALQCSVNGTNWEAMTGSGGTAITKAVTTNDTWIWDVVGTGVKYVRVVFTSSSGDGYVTIWMQAKANA